jgi:hypothetical protein
MKSRTFKITAKLWLYPGESANWHFLTIPKDISEKIKALKPATPRGWGSVRVEVKIGKIIWSTSVFPDKRSGTYILPVKAVVRRTEGIFEGDQVTFNLTILQ